MTESPMPPTHLDPIEKARRARGGQSKIRHWYWEHDAEVARLLGVQVRGLCGVWTWPSRMTAAEQILVQADGSARDPRRDCRRCMAVLDAPR